jgi:hypothetical protein
MYHFQLKSGPSATTRNDPYDNNAKQGREAERQDSQAQGTLLMSS